jgi:hypothetical protein
LLGWIGYGLSDGKVVAYLPAEANEGEPLWRLEHFDGDQEDLDLEDLTTAIRHFDNDCKEDDNRMEEDDQDDSSDDDDQEEESLVEVISKVKQDMDSSTLWPTGGVRTRWIASIQRAQTIGELAMGLSSLLEYGKSFGAVGEDPMELAKGSASGRFWIKCTIASSSSAATGAVSSATHTIASPAKAKSSSRSRRANSDYFDDFKRPTRNASKEASKRIKSSYSDY